MSDINPHREAPMPADLETAHKEIRRLRHIVSLDVDAQMAKRFEKLCCTIKSLRGEIRILRAELDRQIEHVKEMIEVRKTLSPIGVELGHAPGLIEALRAALAKKVATEVRDAMDLEEDAWITDSQIDDIIAREMKKP